ncbi:VOC family protein [Ruminococcaceae bacterium OttesenSCG-928-D13]|nr:VOC family protein [Ruminococcaceae bacterium OttesenSCG-928-D13]
MNFKKLTVRVLVKKDYGACYDFYTQKLGLEAKWGGREGPYTSFGLPGEDEPFFAIFNMANMSLMEGYTIPADQPPADNIVGVIPSADLDGDYQRLKAAGVELVGEPQTVEDWGMRLFCFRDTEGNLFEVNDSAGGV